MKIFRKQIFLSTKSITQTHTYLEVKIKCLYLICNINTYFKTLKTVLKIGIGIIFSTKHAYFKIS